MGNCPLVFARSVLRELGSQQAERAVREKLTKADMGVGAQRRGQLASRYRGTDGDW